MFPEDDLLPISALQHLLYCPRQCALIHIERLWAENVLTVQGRQLHDKAHAGGGESRRQLRTARGLMVRSLKLGIWGQADVVEFHEEVPFPVEYKRGRPKKHDADRVQLCAQAMCLEEMLQTSVPAGALFYGRTRRRQEILFNPPLRQLTLDTIARLHELIGSGRTPPAVYDEGKCSRCSLQNLCLPEAGADASAYLRRSLSHALSHPSLEGES